MGEKNGCLPCAVCCFLIKYRQGAAIVSERYSLQLAPGTMARAPCLHRGWFRSVLADSGADARQWQALAKEERRAITQAGQI